MYQDHNPLIAAGMRDDPEIFVRGVLFSALSARQPIVSVPDMLRDIDKNGGDAIALALPNKWACWQFLQEHGTRTWREAWDRDTAEALPYLARIVPGLGIVKAAFTLQLMGHDIACLDSHNIKLEKCHPRAFGCRGAKAKAYADYQVKKYLALAGGRARELWDRWCTNRAEWYETTPDAISALHLEVIR